MVYVPNVLEATLISPVVGFSDNPAGVALYVPVNEAVGVTFALPEHSVFEGYVNEASSTVAAVTLIGADKGPRQPLLFVTCAVYVPVVVAVIDDVDAPATGVVPLNH
jgi:hypothetical protein